MREAPERLRLDRGDRAPAALDERRAHDPAPLGRRKRLDRQSSDVEIREHEVSEITAQRCRDSLARGGDRVDRRRNFLSIEDGSVAAANDLQPDGGGTRHLRRGEPEVQTDELASVRLQIERTELDRERRRPARDFGFARGDDVSTVVDHSDLETPLGVRSERTVEAVVNAVVRSPAAATEVAGATYRRALPSGEIRRSSTPYFAAAPGFRNVAAKTLSPISSSPRSTP